MRFIVTAGSVLFLIRLSSLPARFALLAGYRQLKDKTITLPQNEEGKLKLSYSVILSCKLHKISLLFFCCGTQCLVLIHNSVR